MATSGRAARLRECLVSGRETQTYSRYESRAYQTGDSHGLPLASALPRTMKRFASTIDRAIEARSSSCVTFALFSPDRSYPYDSGRAETSSSSLDTQAQLRRRAPPRRRDRPRAAGAIYVGADAVARRKKAHAT